MRAMRTTLTLSKFLPPIKIGLIHANSSLLTLIAIPSPLSHSAIMKNKNTNEHYSSNHSPEITKKRKIVWNEDGEQQTLTLESGFNVGCSSSNSKHCKSTQSTSYHRNRGSESKDVHRKWSYSKNDCSGFRDKFVLASYNILGVENASRHPDLYCKVPCKYMKWDHRRVALCKELAQYDPSILCFQEVDCFSDLCDALQQDGYKGVLKARTGDARDGCAIFWKSDRFRLLHEENIEFQHFGLRNNVAQFCVLESNLSLSQLKCWLVGEAGNLGVLYVHSITTGKTNDDRSNCDPKMSKTTCRSLVVGNTHVLFNPSRGDIKLGQVRLFLEKAHRLAKEWGGIPVVLAGDFNSVPQSAVYQYISSAKLNILQHDRRRISGQIGNQHHHSFRQKPVKFRWNGEELKLATGSKMVSCLQHSLKLRSAYLGVPGTFATRDIIGEPLATLCLSNFMGTVDYIWHNDQLVPVRVLETLPRNALKTMGGLPSKDWGSDHLALVCEFAFANSET